MGATFERAASHPIETPKNTTTQSDTLNIIREMRMHIQNDGCSHCKTLLRRIFFIENNEAGSIGGKTTEHGRTADTNR